MRTTTSYVFISITGILVVGALAGSGALAQTQSPDQMTHGKEAAFPPNARPGECYARVLVTPMYKTEKVRILKSEATERIDSKPAKYEWIEEKVVVQEPSENIEVIPATYEWVEEKVLVRPASTHTEVVPAVHETLTEKVIDTPAHTVWKKGRGPLERINHSTGEIMCLIEVPATYKTLKKKILKEPAATRTVEVPAEYKTVKKRVMKTPPSTRVIKIPAKYKMLRVRKLVEPAKTRSIPVPAEYEWVEKQVKVAEGRMEWQTVLCETNTTAGAVESIQNALLKSGYNPGKIDGVIGSQTRKALESYQRAKGLPTGGLTIDTLKSLGVKTNQS